MTLVKKTVIEGFGFRQVELASKQTLVAGGISLIRRFFRAAWVTVTHPSATWERLKG